MAETLSKIKGPSNKPLSIKQRKYLKGVMSGMPKVKAAEYAGYGKQPRRDIGRKIESSPTMQKAFKLAMKQAGIDDASIVRVLKEGLSATDLKGKDAIEHPDYGVRLNYVQYINKARGIEATSKLDVTSGGKPISFGLDKLLNPTLNEEGNESDAEDQED